MKPPIWIRAFSYLFIILGMVLVLMEGMTLFDPNMASHIRIGFLTRSFAYVEHPGLYGFALILFALAGVTGMAIITRRKYAYDIGIAYSVCALIFFGCAAASDWKLAGNVTGGFTLQLMIFVAFLIYLAKNRGRWSGSGKVKK